MIYSVIITIVVIGIILWILSFFMQDKFRQIEDEFEQFTISSLQESYQLKKKIKVLEEELLVNEKTEEETMKMNQNETPIMREIRALYQQGLDANKIAQQMNLNEYDVKSMIKQLY
ncbi:hypothetical protein J416_05668 [Gracilibacillus halophilus YIM-C55.5]|uniref:Resolvase HTH domain-containing protein n=1 Tax=Gracilibacillus halophilus YIM-C55.5 TaxID=1308866 RepID=N4WDZ8_9BACI|nr:hypothetical protein [Gracilibacillus halophilus]ENH97474.1 hypothetical protein J416_05668 [Gracilibacillus halophilus YIM-C55.5]